MRELIFFSGDRGPEREVRNSKLTKQVHTNKRKDYDIEFRGGELPAMATLREDEEKWRSKNEEE